jgi:hypothetical protein
MFERKLSEQEILIFLRKRKSEIKNLDKLPRLDKLYLSFLSKCERVEIIPDIMIWEYEKALTENRYLNANYPKIGQTLWIIGETGQGDEWFINMENNYISFYDHNQGEYSNMEQFICFDISFLEFLQMAFLYQELENSMNEKVMSKGELDNFCNMINSIRPNLYELYPFKYW